jgi:hypothetical protein
MIRVVLTGGPGAGKSSVSRRLADSSAGRIAFLPEAASAVYEQLATRWDLLDPPHRRDMQRRIYRLQIDRESAPLPDGTAPKILLHDRGTIDGAAYWPDGPDAYWTDLGTTHQSELARYDAVIWLETGAILGIYDGGASNPARFEKPAEAVHIGQLVGQLWSVHPHFFRVSAYPTLDQKIAQVETILASLHHKK